jgi:hypothetical protein
MSKQTAVEWLIKKLTNRQNGIFDGFPHLSLDEIYSQAKAMEKERMEDAFMESRLTHPMSGFKHELFDDYFNETYGGDQCG